MLLPIMEAGSAARTANDALIKTISSRIAGGRREVNKDPSQVPIFGTISSLSLLSGTGHSGYARVSVHITVSFTCLEITRHSGDTHRWRLYSHARHLH
jgi:hypothetical protein